MDPVQFLKCISFFSLDRIIIYWNRLYDLRSLVGLPVWFCWTKHFYKSSVLHQPLIAFLCAIIMNKIIVVVTPTRSSIISHFEIVEEVQIRQRMSVAQVMQATVSLICCFI